VPHQARIDSVQPAAIMTEEALAKTWDNVACRFWTQNTVNDRGNSEYIVFANK